MRTIHLGVNIDHVATLRQARGGHHPDLLWAAQESVAGGADSITVHLREDRRHIQDSDLPALKKILKVPLNLEMALADEIVSSALRLGPEKCCIVPEKRQEITTEGGLNVFANRKKLVKVIPSLRKKGIEVSLFIAPDPKQIRLSLELGAQAIEIHTGAFANARAVAKTRELAKIKKACILAHRLGLFVHAGHGLDYENVRDICGMPYMRELNIGHAIVSRAIFWGMRRAVEEMKKLVTLV